MALSPSDRIGLIRHIREQLIDQDFADADLTVHEFGLGELDSDDWHVGDRGAYLTARLRLGNDGDLVALSEHLGFIPAPDASTAANEPRVPAMAKSLTVFASHSAVHREYVGLVATNLGVYGVDMFVAHRDIEPDEEWHDAILDSLRACDAGVAFLHQEFKTSDWCDQEAGWLLGRGIPVFSVRIDLAPYGPLGRRQAIPGVGVDPHALASQILDKLDGRPELSRSVLQSLVQSLGNTTSFNQTDRVWERLRHRLDLTSPQCGAVIDAIGENSQVYRAHYGMRTYPEVIAEFLRGQVGFVGLESKLQAVLDEL